MPSLPRLPTLTLLAATLLSLAACSPQRPDILPPVVVPCPKPQVSPELRRPAERKAMEALARYLDSLPPPSPSAAPTPTDSTH